MTRKDYVLLAKVLNERINANIVHNVQTAEIRNTEVAALTLELSRAFKLDNPRFNVQTFYSAVGLPCYE